MADRDFNKLKTKYKDVEVDEVQLRLYGLTFPELAEFTGFMDKKDNKGGLNYLLKSTLRKTITVQEMDDAALDNFIKELSADVATQIIKTVTELSGLGKLEAGEKK